MSNICFNIFNSCSSCCGFHNISFSADEKREWLKENTKKFMSLNISNRAEVLDFRHLGEKFLQPRAIRKDVYICPFIGNIGESEVKTGCLLHKSGSPHVQVKNSDSPQSFSFYGESICKSYDCLSKQSISLYFESVIKVCKFKDPLIYGKIVSNHNLLHICSKLSRNSKDFFEKLLERIIEILENTEIPVTSFEMPLDLSSYSEKDLWSVLGTMFDNKGYLFDAFHVSEEGRINGRQIEKSLA